MDQQHLKTANKSHKITCDFAKRSTCCCAEALGSQYIDTVSASALTGLSTRALDTLRYRGGGPRYFRIGRRIRYRTDDLRAWMERCAVLAAEPAVACSPNSVGGNNG